MWTIAANFRRTHSQVIWLGLRVGGHLALSLHSSDEPGELLQWLWSWWQHHKHCHGYYYYYYLLAATDWYLLPARLKQQTCTSGFATVGPCWDRWTDTVPLHRPCSTDYAGSANKQYITTVNCNHLNVVSVKQTANVAHNTVSIILISRIPSYLVNISHHSHKNSMTASAVLQLEKVQAE